MLNLRKFWIHSTFRFSLFTKILFYPSKNVNNKAKFISFFVISHNLFFPFLLHSIFIFKNLRNFKNMNCILRKNMLNCWYKIPYQSTHIKRGHL